MIFSAIAYAVGFAVGFLGAAAGLSMTTILSLATVAGNIATGLVLNAISRALAPKVQIPQSEVQAIIQQTDAPRRVYVGQYLAGGIRAFFATKASVLHQLVVVAHGQISEFREFWIDGVKVSTNASGVVTSGSKSPHVTVETRNGSGAGGDYPILRQRFTSWTTARKLQGIATFLVRASAPGAEDFSKAFPKSYNTVFQWVIRGARVFDPRSGQTAYSDNAALVIGHYLTHEGGYRLDRTEVSWPSVSAMAYVSDRPVPQKAGGSAPSLRIWGYWTMDEEPANVLARWHTNSGIRAYEMQDGRIGLIGGPYGEPACTLTAKDISQIATSEAISEREGYNTLRVFHLDSKQKYEIIEIDPWVDTARLEQEGEIAQEFRVEMCPSRSQARRLAKEQIHDDNRAKVEIITNLVGLKARYPRRHGQRHTILLDYRPEDGSGRVIQGEYEVMDHEFDPVGMQCRIELARVNRASQSWSASEEGETVADLPEDESDLAPAMTAVLTQRVLQVAAGSQQAILDVDAAPVPDRSDLSLQAQYRKVGVGAWRDMTGSTFSLQSPAVEDGQQYEVQARWLGVFEGVAPWVMLGPITVQIAGTPPDAPTELSASASGGQVSLSWRNPAASFFGVRVYRGTDNAIGNALFVGAVPGASGQISQYQDADAASGVTYFYWIVAATASGIEGPSTGPTSISA